MKKEGISLFVMYVFAGLGLIAGLIFAIGWSNGKVRVWDSAPLPEESLAHRFVIFEAPVVYVETDDGRVFVQHLSADEPTWEQIRPAFLGEVSHTLSGSCAFTSSDWSGYRRPPGVIRERLECTLYRTILGGDEYRYVILDNGDVWRWENPSLGLGYLGFFLLALAVGAFVGVLIGLGFLGLVYWVKGRSIEAEALDDQYPWPPPVPIHVPIQYTPPHFCPQCGLEMVLTSPKRRIYCSHCDYHFPDEHEFLQAAHPIPGDFHYCERCGSEIGNALDDCPTKSLDECPYTRTEHPTFRSTEDRFFGWIMLLVAFVLLAIRLLYWESSDIWLSLFCVVTPMCFGIWGVFSRQQILKNQVTGVYWERFEI